MGKHTSIEWADATWNPWRGCVKVSEGCKNCYMFRDQRRYGLDPSVVVRSKTTFSDPLTWTRTGKVASGARIFTCSWSDWFIEDADEWRTEAWDIVRQTPQFNYLILTKRPELIAARLPPDWGDGYDNVWLGVSAENQRRADERLPILLSIPATIYFVSAEPLLGPLNLSRYTWPPNNFGIVTRAAHAALRRINWTITGGESDLKNPRSCDLDWVRSIRDQCIAAGIAFFHKQNGGTRKIDGAWGGRELDGRTWDEFPAIA